VLHEEIIEHKYVFVCGLPRSGTSVLGRNIGRLENCTQFKNTGVFEDEGEFLQDIYPIASTYGGVGSFGFDSRTHRTEISNLLTAENVNRLRASWHAHWDNRKAICVEKTPGNLLMTRFLQAAFPNSYFIVIKRHPVPMCMAGQKWKVDVNSLHTTFEHWLHCHELFEKDKKYLKRVYELRYEDYADDPAKYHQEIAAFIGTRVPDPPKEDEFRYVTQWRNPTGLRVPEKAMEKVTAAYSEKYFDRWCKLLRHSSFKSYYRYIARQYEPRFAKFGYSLTERLETHEKAHLEQVKIPAASGILYCFAADAIAFIVRVRARFIGHVKKQLRTLLPEPVKLRIRRVRQGTILSKKRPSMQSP
jgi:hypothetical protein